MSGAACPRRDDLVRLAGGGLPPDGAAALGAHVAGCGACRDEQAALRTLIADIAAPPPGDPIDLAPLVLRRLGAGESARPRRAGWRWVGASAVAAAGALAAAVAVTVGPDASGTASSPAAGDGFRARGGADAPDKWAGLRLYRRGADGRAEPLGDRMARGDALLVAYDNAGPEPYRYLLVYARDAGGAVRWLYPAWTDPVADPAAIPIRPGGAVELPDAVRHQLSPGPLRIAGVFLRSPMTARQVEAGVAPPPGSAEVSRVVRVE